jgi:hypothetical protein
MLGRGCQLKSQAASFILFCSCVGLGGGGGSAQFELRFKGIFQRKLTGFKLGLNDRY